jgi:D-glycero-D-manno-heptose 1,7-bisphosphate phosphatase
VLLSLLVLGVTAAVQALIFVLSGSVALLADPIHNAGDALTAIPLGIAFLLRSAVAERRAGYAVVVATNQSGVGRGLLDDETLRAIHGKMRRAVEAAGGHLTDIVYCPHRPEDACACRKPKPGLFRQIAERHDVALAGVPVIGDSARDLDAASAIGARPILVLTGKGRATLAAIGSTDVEVYPDLAATAAQLVRESAGVPS